MASSFGMHGGLVLTSPATSDGIADVVLPQAPLASGGRDEAWLRDFLLRHPFVLQSAVRDLAYENLIPVFRELDTSNNPAVGALT